MTLSKHLMPVGDVARALGLSIQSVKNLDDELKPIRLDSNHRRYDPAQVQRYAAKRARAVRTVK
jgi:DNA-binding transcriptional MerR regulator